MEMTAGGSIACGISCSELERAWNLQRRSTKKPHSLGVLFFWPWYFQGMLQTFMESHLQWTSVFPEFPRQNLETSVSIYLKAFPQPHCLFFSGTND